MTEQPVIGIDIGGTKTNIATISPQGKPDNLQKIASSSENPEQLKNDILKRVQDVSQKTKGNLAGIGIATAGRVNFREKKILYTTSNLKGWSDIDITGVLKEKFKCPVFIDNDVNAALLSELKLNTIKGRVVIFIAIGTGLGGAIAIDGNIIRGNTGSVGEFGHMVLYPGGKKCNCGKKGCVEQYISGTAYRNRLKNKLEKTEPRSNQNLTVEMIQKKIMAGKKPYITVLKNMTRDLTLLLDNLKNCLDFDTCIIGGGFHVYRNIILAELNRYYDSAQYKYMDNPTITFSQQKNEAGVIGAGLMVYDSLPSLRK